MADFHGSARSNYFQVRDVEAFKAEGHHAINVITNSDGLVALLSQDHHGVWPTHDYNEETDEDVDFSVVDWCASHLVDGHVAVLVQIGAEKLRYLSGHAVAVNSVGDTRTIDLGDIVELGRELGGHVTSPTY